MNANTMKPQFFKTLMTYYLNCLISDLIKFGMNGNKLRTQSMQIMNFDLKGH